MSWDRATGYSDGAARGNPGPAGAGGILIDKDTGEIVELGRFLGAQTNNVAEYEGFIMVLEAAKSRGVRELSMCTDSELLVKQIQGVYRVKAEHLMPFVEKAKALMKAFPRIDIKHVRRELNKEADRMSNLAIDNKMK
ncbi:MAG: ribonuclease HI family protein [Deltaproteobacteria bacterium]|nr:ribonuclease HI family protein [Deltaproteobacteria bacterium]